MPRNPWFRFQARPYAPAGRSYARPTSSPAAATAEVPHVGGSLRLGALLQSDRVPGQHVLIGQDSRFPDIF